MLLKNYEIIVILFVIFFSFFVFLFVGIFLGKLLAGIKFNKEISKIRKDAVTRSRSVLTGQFIEEISPFLPHFPYNPKDLKFLGSPVDFIVFDGISNQELKEVIFLEIKTGNSKLNFNEKKLKEIIDNKKVCYREYRIKD